MPKYISENYEGVKRNYNDRHRDEIVSSYRLLLVGLIAGGFDIWVVLNSLVKEILDLIFMKTARGLISLSIRCGVKLVDMAEVLQYAEFTCTSFSKERFCRKIGGECGLQPENLEVENEHPDINKSNYGNLTHIWEPYFKIDVLCLAFKYARKSLEMQNMSRFVIEVCFKEIF